METNPGIEKASKGSLVALGVAHFVTGLFFVGYLVLNLFAVFSLFAGEGQSYPFGSEAAGVVYSSEQIYFSTVAISVLLCAGAILSRFFVRSAWLLWGIQLTALSWCLSMLVLGMNVG